ncbi:MAG: hypothetical protein H6813_05515 [Phycisphaeraceae bacterium]|nr:hypothetical protein [Phycisphaeraceae bacterium]MCB9847926.1 hypothetical protein [Phycisphaeraceae bacterium]
MKIRRLVALGALLAGAGAAQGAVNETRKLLPSDGARLDYFGSSVAIDGDLAIIGADGDDDNGFDSGSAYVFHVLTGQQLAKLLPSDGAAGDEFGASVAISGGLAVVGAIGGDDNGYGSGSAYVFDVNTGQQLVKLLPSDGAAGRGFGYSVAISGGLAIVGARLDEDNGRRSGSAYVFDAETGQQLHKLLALDGTSADYLGGSVAIDSGLAILGAHGDDDHGSGRGSVYVFDATTGQQLEIILPDDGAAGVGFGASVASNDGLVLVGAGAFITGSAYVFDPMTWQQQHKLLHNDGFVSDLFGRPVAISGGLAIIGASGDDDNGVNSGSAYVFDAKTGQQLVKLLPSDGAFADRFGQSVAISDGLALVGAWEDGDNGDFSGSAYLFDLTPCIPSDLNLDGVVDTADLGALIGRIGTASVVADLSGDGIVDMADLGMLLDDFGKACP